MGSVGAEQALTPVRHTRLRVVADVTGGQSERTRAAATDAGRGTEGRPDADADGWATVFDEPNPGCTPDHVAQQPVTVPPGDGATDGELASSLMN